MKKSTLSLIVAGVMAIGGIAQAETFDTPTQAGEASTMTMGQPNQLTSNSPWGDNSVAMDSGYGVDTTVLGAAPSTVMVPMDHSVYIRPGYTGSWQQRHQAAASFDTPARAGEASTMTGGAPNVLTDNTRLAGYSVVDVYSVPSLPYSAAGSSYYGS
jgi:hypothetical protein